jgi:streptogramin lyase
MFARAAVTVLLTCVLASCSAGAGTVPRNGLALSGQSLLPEVVQKGKDAQWVLFAPHTLGALYSAIVLGPDDNLWFIDETGAGLVRIAENGSIKEFALSGVLTGSAVSMTVGADKNFYVLDESTNVVRVTVKGKAQLFAIPSGDGTSIDGLALGPDGNVWFAEFNHIGKITPAGKITEFAYPPGFSTNQYGGVSAGSDGNVWFAESSGNAIGRIVPKSGKITMFAIPVACTPASLVPAKDKNLWFACLANAPQLGSITPSGKIATYGIGGAFSSNETEQFCSEGPDGEPWCASGNDGNVFRVNTKAHTVTTFTPPLGSGVRPDALAGGSDGNVWVDTVGGEIAVLVANPITVTPNKLEFSGPGQTKTVTVKENGTSSWSAKSSNSAVATVVQGSAKSVFKVKSVAKGRCKVVISDGAGNSVQVGVTVE